MSCSSKNINKNSNQKLQILFGFLGTVPLIAAAFINPINHYLSGFLIFFFAVALYFLNVFFVTNKNWLDLRAAFTAFYVATIGLASLRLTDYQKEWEFATWIIMAATYAAFYFGICFGLKKVDSFQSFFEKKKDSSIFGIRFRLHEERLFWISFVVTLIGVFSFLASFAIKGYIPYFSSSVTAYLDFYTKFHIFSVACVIVSGLSYYVLRTQKLSLWKKIFLVFSIVYSTFLFPMLVVSRGIFMMAALSLTTVVFYLHKKRFGILLLCTVVIIVFYKEGTTARGYSEDQLNMFFEPSTIITNPEKPPETDISENTETSEGQEQTPSDHNGAQSGFQLSGTSAFLYTYLTVSHDNFNEAVLNLENYTYGARQFIPFNVIFRIDSINEFLSEAETFLVRNHLNTVNLFGEAFYDFGAVGTVILSFIWAFFFGLIQGYYQKQKGVFSLLSLGSAMTPTIMCFFASWMSNFSLWIQWGLIFLMFLSAFAEKQGLQQSNE